MAKKRILIVDDEAMVAEPIRCYLENTGEFTVRSETDALKAVATARDFNPDLILVDFIMPGMEGDDLAMALEADPQVDAEIVFLTGALSDEELGGEGRIGKYTVLTKPIGPDEIHVVLRERLLA